MNISQPLLFAILLATNANGVYGGFLRKSASNDITPQRELAPADEDIPLGMCAPEIWNKDVTLGRETSSCGERIKYLMTPEAYSNPNLHGKLIEKFQHSEGQTSLTPIEACIWIKTRNWQGDNSCDCSCTIAPTEAPTTAPTGAPTSNPTEAPVDPTFSPTRECVDGVDHVSLRTEGEISVRLDHAVGDPPSYLQMTFNNGTFSGESLPGWSVDVDRLIRNKKTYHADMYSSYEANQIHAGAVDKASNVAHLNWLINNIPNGATVDATMCGMGPEFEISWKEYQRIIWKLMDFKTGDNYIRDYQTEECIVDLVVDTVMEQGGDYVPECSDPDAKIALMAVVDAEDGETITHEVLVAEVLLQATTACDNICASSPALSPSGSPSALPSTLPSSSPTDDSIMEELWEQIKVLQVENNSIMKELWEQIKVLQVENNRLRLEKKSQATDGCGDDK